MNNAGLERSRAGRSLFWRLWRRSLTVKRPQAALAICSVLVGATVASMLLNLYGDARRKMTQEFRAYGPNVVLVSSEAMGDPGQAASGVMDESVMDRLAPFAQRSRGFAAVPSLYVVTRLAKATAPDDHTPSPDPENVVAVGTDFGALSRLYPSWRIEGSTRGGGAPVCAIGTHIAAQMRMHLGDSIQLDTITNGAAQTATFPIANILSTGTAEDDQVFVPLASLQLMNRLAAKVSVVEMSVPGETADIERVMAELNTPLSGIHGIEVRPIRQIVYSAGRVLDTIRWVMLSLTGLILIIIALCVTATMTAIVLERRKDIAVMKSLGANDRLVMRLFLTEGVTMGLIGGCGGFALGLVLAHEMARQLFGVSLNPTWWTFPLVCFASMMLAGVATLFPVEIVRGIQPARVLRGD